MSKRAVRRAKRRRQQQIRRILTISLVTVGAVLVAFALIYPSIKPVGGIAAITPNPRPMAEANAMGDPNAPIKIEEFSDFQCPACQHFFMQTEKQVIDTYVATGKVYFIYRSMGNFIGDNIEQSTGVPNSESRDAAEAAYCASEQNKFWEYHDILFANHTGEGAGDFIPRRLTAYAETLGLDMAAFRGCLGSDKYLQQVEQDFEDGAAAGVDTTPSFLITYTVNGETKQKLIKGSYPFSQYQQEIEAALAEMGQQ